MDPTTTWTYKVLKTVSPLITAVSFVLLLRSIWINDWFGIVIGAALVAFWFATTARIAANHRELDRHIAVLRRLSDGAPE